MEQIHIMVVDDHEIVRDGIRAMLLGNNRIKLIAEAANIEDLFNLLNEHHPHIILLDINLPGISGIKGLEMLNEKYPEIKIIMISSIIDAAVIQKTIKLGCIGYLPKDSGKKELISAIENAAEDRPYFGKKIQDIVFSGFVQGVKNQKYPNIPLSDREIEVLIFLANGLSHKETAEKLYISHRTVEAHKKTIYEKMKFNNIADLVKFAIRNQLIDL